MLSVFAHPLFYVGNFLLGVGLIAAEQTAPQTSATNVALWCGIFTTVGTFLLGVAAFVLRMVDRRQGRVTLTRAEYDELKAQRAD